MDSYGLAVRVLLDDLHDFKRAEEYAMKIDNATVWSSLGLALVDAGRVTEGINAVLKVSCYVKLCTPLREMSV